MRITDEQGTYQGWLNIPTGLFTQSSELVTDVIKINEDVVKTLELEGCKFIETATYKNNHAEPYYIGLEKFMEVALHEWNHDERCFYLVYKPEEEKPEPNERQEVRSNLY